MMSRAAPVRYCESLMKDQSAAYHAIVANSGNANACTGRQGRNRHQENGFRSRPAFQYPFQGSARLFDGKNW